MMPAFKTFASDRIVRNEQGLPMGRAVLVGGYEPGKDIAMAVLEVFNALPTTVKNLVFYVDGEKYKVPADHPDVKMSMSGGKLLLNNFFLVKL